MRAVNEGIIGGWDVGPDKFADTRYNLHCFLGEICFPLMYKKSDLPYEIFL